MRIGPPGTRTRSKEYGDRFESHSSAAIKATSRQAGGWAALAILLALIVGSLTVFMVSESCFAANSTYPTPSAAPKPQPEHVRLVTDHGPLSGAITAPAVTEE